MIFALDQLLQVLPGGFNAIPDIVARRDTLAKVLATIAETERAGETGGRREPGHVSGRLAVLRAFFAAVDLGLGAFTQGKPLDPELLRVSPARARQRG